MEFEVDVSGKDIFNEKRVMHIDTSCKLYENKDTGIAYKILGTNKHKGLVINKKLKRELKKKFDMCKDFARLYSVSIYYLIKDDLDEFDILIICADENFKKVRDYLDILFQNDKKYSKKDIISIVKLREITDNKNLRSAADKIANSYRKRGLKSINKKQEGIPLNVVPINYNKIIEKFNEINQKVSK
ncbi:MAG: hypothetical protein AABX54_00245 [Nanoarchaeota archaeon]